MNWLIAKKDESNESKKQEKATEPCEVCVKMIAASGEKLGLV